MCVCVFFFSMQNILSTHTTPPRNMSISVMSLSTLNIQKYSFVYVFPQKKSYFVISISSNAYSNIKQRRLVVYLNKYTCFSHYNYIFRYIGGDNDQLEQINNNIYRMWAKDFLIYSVKQSLTSIDKVALNRWLRSRRTSAIEYLFIILIHKIHKVHEV